MSAPSQSTQPLVPRRAAARLAAVDARAMAAQAAGRCRIAAPDAEWLLAVPLRLPPVPGGVPPRPLILGVAALATANAAVALALELVMARGDAAAIGLTLTTASRLGIAAREGIYIVDSGGSPRQRQRLAHSTALATHAAADALATYALAASSRGFDHVPRPEYAFPRARGRGVDALKMRLFCESPSGGDGESIPAAEAAYDAVAHGLQVCALPFPRLGACAAEHRVARAVCLASTFVGWAALGSGAA